MKLSSSPLVVVGLKTLEGEDGISLLLLCGIHDGEIEEIFWREGSEQKIQKAQILVRIGGLTLFNSWGALSVSS